VGGEIERADGPGSSVSILTGYGLNGPGIENRWGGGEIERAVGPGSSVSIVTGYGLDDPGIESQ